MSKHNKEIARRFFEEILSRGELGIVDELFASDVVMHTPMGEFHEPEGAKQFASMLRQGFPDLEATIENQVAEGDRVATRWTARGTHGGELQGKAPTGKTMAITGITIFRLADSKILEAWGNADMLGMMQQLGAVPVPGEG